MEKQLRVRILEKIEVKLNICTKFSQKNEVQVRLDEIAVPKYKQFGHQGLLFQENRIVNEDVTQKNKTGWLKWKYVTKVLCCKRMAAKVKGKFNRTTIRPTMLFDSECQAA